MEENKTTKTCSVCGKALPLDAFHKNARSKDGLSSFCKDCHRTFAKRGGRKMKKEEEVKDKVVLTTQPGADTGDWFAECKTAEDCARVALKFVVGANAFKEWEEVNDLYNTLYGYYSR